MPGHHHCHSASTLRPLCLWLKLFNMNVNIFVFSIYSRSYIISFSHFCKYDVSANMSRDDWLIYTSIAKQNAWMRITYLLVADFDETSWPADTSACVVTNMASALFSFIFADHLISAVPASLDKRCDGCYDSYGKRAHIISLSWRESFYETAGRSHYECPLMVIPHPSGAFFMPKLAQTC